MGSKSHGSTIATTQMMLINEQKVYGKKLRLQNDIMKQKNYMHRIVSSIMLTTNLMLSYGTTMKKEQHKSWRVTNQKQTEKKKLH